MTLTEHLMGSNSNSVLNKWIKFYAIFSHFIKNSVVLIRGEWGCSSIYISLRIRVFVHVETAESQ